MGYKNLRAAVNDLESKGMLVRISDEVDPVLEMAAIHRRVYAASGPAIYFEKVKGSRFPAVSNIYGTQERVDYLFRKEIPIIRELARVRNDPKYLLRHLTRLPTLGLYVRYAAPKELRKAVLLSNKCSIDELPAIKSWPDDGGKFVTMPMVMSEDPDYPGMRKANIGMYRIQLDGNDYEPGQEVGLHYQIHRGIGVHHQKYIDRGQPFKVSIGVGGPPAHAMAAILPLPEGMSESVFAGLLNSSRFHWIRKDGYLIDATADFVITGTVIPDTLKPEGPFGDHLGYYSLRHPFPVLKVDNIYHRSDAIWHFTVVGRPPAEDSGFGYMIHKLFDETVKAEFPGVIAVHAVDTAGVHPLLLATGQERYMPFRDQRPEEILTIANRLLGSGQTSLAKYLWIAADAAGQVPDVYDLKSFFKFMLERINFQRDLHFITNTTIDTLDYSGNGLNMGSKVIIAAYGEPLRKMEAIFSSDFRLAEYFSNPQWYQPGILMIEAKAFENYEIAKIQIKNFCELNKNNFPGIGLIILVDDADFASMNDANFSWVTFTRSDPAMDLYGCNEKYIFKHWSVDAPLIIDARKKPHHAPELIPDPTVEERADRFFTVKGPLAKWQ